MADDPTPRGEEGAVPVERLRAMINLLYPEEMTPTAKRQLESVCHVYDAVRGSEQ